MSDSLLILLKMMDEIIDRNTIGEAFSTGADLNQAKKYLKDRGRTKAANWIESNFKKIEVLLSSPPFALGDKRDDRYVKIRPKGNDERSELYLKLKDQRITGLKIGRGSIEGPSQGIELEKKLKDFFTSFRDSEVDEKQFFDFVEQAKTNQPGPDLSVGFISPDGEYSSQVNIEIKLSLGSNAEFVQIATLPKSVEKYPEESIQKKIFQLYHADESANSKRVREQLKRKYAEIDLFYIVDRFYTPEVVFGDENSNFKFVIRARSLDGKKGPRLNVCLYSIDESKGFDETKIGKFFE